MLRPRLIPVLLLKDDGLVKSKRFGDFQYIGDPINAVRIFNRSNCDELIILDISAGKSKKPMSADLVKAIGEEANMPFVVGGGINSIDHIAELINAGAERVIITTAAVINPSFISQAAATFGSSTIIAGIDVKHNTWKKEKIWTNNGTRSHSLNTIEFARQMEDRGAGELLIHAISRDGMMEGYDIELTKRVTESVTIPVTALGGAGNLDHVRDVFYKSHANGVAAGSLFVYQGNDRGVLINYPTEPKLVFTQ